jgi:hypothetical protein
MLQIRQNGNRFILLARLIFCLLNLTLPSPEGEGFSLTLLLQEKGRG